MAPKKNNSLCFLTLTLFALSSIAHASKAPRGAVYSSTVEDGTPKMLKGTTTLEDDENENLPPAPKSVRSRKRILEKQKPQAKQTKTTFIPEGAEFVDDSEISETNDNDSEESVAADTSEKTAPTSLSSNVENEIANLKKANQDLAQRLSQLEAQKAQDSKLQAKEMATAMAMAVEEELLSKAPVEKPVAKTDEATIKKMRTAGDKIPSERIADVSERLKYANDIVKRFGIAYDYRSMTLKDFKRVLAKLESKNKNTNSMETTEAEN